METQIARIELDRSDSKEQADLERYRAKMLELGATRAAVIDAADIPVDERVTLKCQIPRCFGYGVSAHCPPNTLAPAELRAHLEKFRKAVFFTKDVAPEVITRNRETIKERTAVYKDVFEIVNQVESLAFYDGHYLAFGLAAGSCRHSLCAQAENCRAMEGDRCCFSLKSRPSMEAVGIDVFRLVAGLGWEIYPIGSDAKAARVPKGTLAGLVVVC
jgi:predicted metal-binding protein